MGEKGEIGKKNGVVDKNIKPLKKLKGLDDVALGVASHEIIGRYGDAASEFLKGYSGEITENGKVLEKGLKQISESKVHPDFKYQNLKQQAGFSAEVHYENKINAQNIINRSSERISRTDNLGMTNHTKFDFLAVDVEGNPITNSDGPLWGAQMKFCGKYGSEKEIKSSSEKLAKKLAGDKWERYRGNDVLVPEEQYKEIVNYSTQRSKELLTQAKEFRSSGDYDKAIQLEESAKRFEQVSKDVKNSGISSKNAMFLREHAKLATTKYVLETAHQAGVEQAKAGAVISGVLSTARNVLSVASGDKDLSDAMCDIGKDTLIGTSTNYVIASGGTAIKSMMSNSSKEVFVNLSKTNMPAMIATVSVQVGKSLHRYATGEIDELELAEELGEKGTGMLAASWGAAIGTAVFPGIGTVVGGMVGYMSSSVLYQSSTQILNDERMSYERMQRIHEISKAAQVAMKSQQNELNAVISKFYGNRLQEFNMSFEMINNSIIENNIELFTDGLNKIALEMGESLEFKNFQEFDAFMTDNNSILEL